MVLKAWRDRINKNPFTRSIQGNKNIIDTSSLEMSRFWLLWSCWFLVLSIWSHSHIHHCCSICSLFSPLFFLFSLCFPPFVFSCSFPSFPAFCDVDFCFVLLQLSLISHWFVFLFVFFLLLICLAFSLFPSDVTFICSPFCVSCYQ